ncbi:MAG TPA: single-stranded-DNA-specific exonuclease RecJ [Thermoanaerobaculia bacterium]
MSDRTSIIGQMEPARVIWRVADVDETRVARLANDAGLPRTITRLLLARGVNSADEARAFLSPDVGSLHDPIALKGSEESADILVRSARRAGRVVVFGDYDVDGVTAVAQLKAALLRAGADAVSFLPHRLRDGYGLKPETVRRVVADLRPAVIITVDCGISAVEGVACARAAGVEVIVTDHHLVPEELPAGAVVVNPKQPGCGYPEKNLAACGIALKMAQAVTRRAGVSLSQDSLLRAACLGTIADLVPLTGENRTIAAAGLACLAEARAPGLRALLAESGVAPGCAPTSEEIAFRVAPRLNAAGRLDTAELALSLFEERDPARAKRVARELTMRNAERQSLERRLARQVRETIDQTFDPERDAIIVAFGEGWHRGVLGIAASRLAREYHRPVLLFALEGERASGSGRSIPGVALHDTLKEIGHLFSEFGGHDQAIGASLPAARMPDLARAARDLFADRIPRERFQLIEEAEAELEVERVDEELYRHLAAFEPHGIGNPRPVFAAEMSPAHPFRELGETGRRGRIQRSEGTIDTVCWRPELGPRLSAGQRFFAHYRISRNRSGRIELEIVAARDPFFAASAEPAAIAQAQAAK